MPREELGRSLERHPSRIDSPGLETRRGEHPPESLLDKVTVFEGPPGEDGSPSTVPGPKGDKGDTGDPGQAGDPGVVSYRHVQSSPASVWTVNHNLGYRPGGIYAEDSAHTPVVGRVAHIDGNTLTISFFSQGSPAAIGGEADIS